MKPPYSLIGIAAAALLAVLVAVRWVEDRIDRAVSIAFRGG